MNNPPIHCVANDTKDDANMSVIVDELADLLAVDPEEVGCYAHLHPDTQASFLQYEAIVGGYCNCIVGFLGLMGNLLSIIVLSQREMQKNNCFNKLLIGEFSFIVHVRGMSTTPKSKRGKLLSPKVDMTHQKAAGEYLAMDFEAITVLPRVYWHRVKGLSVLAFA